MKLYTINSTKANLHASGAYFHGILEDLIKYDTAYRDQHDTLEAGIREVVIDGYPTVDAILFAWDDGIRVVGLIVDKADTEAIEYAKDRCNAKACVI